MKPLIIVDLGINHNGNMDTALELIKMAKDCGADAVKFQKRDINTVYTKEMLDSPRESPFGKTQRAQKEGLEFSKTQYDEINEYCKELEIDWFASPWDLESIEFLKQYDLKYNKIASAMLTNRNIVTALAGSGKHTFISTGMTRKPDVDWAVNSFKRSGTPFTLLHCVSLYPCDDELCNLERMIQLKRTYDCPVGYSGHERGLTPSLVAVSMGATVIERHITLDRTMYGSDQSASLERRGLELLVRESKMIDKMIRSDKDVIEEKEEEVAKKLRYWEKNV